MAKQGYVKIYRSLQDHWLWAEKPFGKGQAWIDLILLAEYQEHKRLYKGEVKVYPRGTVNISILELSKRWGWSWRKTKTFLSALEKDQMCKMNCTTNDTTLSLENYDFFQVVVAEVANECNNEGHNECHNEGHISNNIKNIKNNNIYNRRPRKKSDAEIMEEAIALVTQRQAEEETEDEQ